MSYVRSRRRGGGNHHIIQGRRRRGAGRGMGDDDYSTCAASADQQTADLDAQTYDLAQNWHPHDDVTPGELKPLIDNVMALVMSARDLNERAASEVNSPEVAQFRYNIEQISTQCTNYYQAITRAQQAGSAVSAPGLKDWVTISMANLSAAMHDSYVIHCMTSWFILLWNSVKGFFAAVYQAAKAIVGVVLAVGQKAIEAVEGGLDMIAMIEKIAPFAAIGLAAWWLFLRENKRSSSTASAV